MKILGRAAQLILFLAASFILGCQQKDGSRVPTEQLVSTEDRYQIHGGEVSDIETGLTWQRCSVGKRWDAEGSRCVGSIKLLTYYESQQQESDSWRVPTNDELLTLIDKKRSGDLQEPHINLEAFPDVDFGNWWYWSSTTSPVITTGAWAITFGNSNVMGRSNFDRGLTGAVRLVRRSRTAPGMPGVTASLEDFSLATDDDQINERYTIKGGEAYDKKTDLIWQRCSVGKHWVEESKRCLGFIIQMTFDQARLQANGPWRVPTNDELLTLVDQRRKSLNRDPAIDLKIFPDMEFEHWWYWSSSLASSSYRTDVKSGLTVTFLGGSGGEYGVGLPLSVRLVRTRNPNEGQWPLNSANGVTANSRISSSPNR